MKPNPRQLPVESRQSRLVLWTGLALLLALQIGSGQTLLLDGDFDSLPIGNAPDAYQPAGNWQFPSDYVSAGLGETDASEFTIVQAPTGSSLNHALQLFARPSLLGDQHLPNIFTEPITGESGKIIRVTFDVYVFFGFGGGGGGVYLGEEGYETRGPQLLWQSDGRLVAAEGTSITVLSTYGRGGWQSMRLDVDMEAQTYDVYTRPVFGWQLLASGLRFRSDSVDFLDRFTIARFAYDSDVWSVFDNISVEAVSPPRIIQQPGTQYVSSSDPCTNLTVVAEGDEPLGYQWFEYDSLSDTTNKLWGETSPALRACADDYVSYFVTISNAYGSVFSDMGSVVYGTAPSIFQQPASVTVEEGNTATFSVDAWGAPLPAYQWQRDSTNLVGVVSDTLALTNTQLADAGAYRVIVSNFVGSVTSSIAFLAVTPRVLPTPPTIIQQPASQAVGAGCDALFSVQASGTPTLFYSWQQGDRPVPYGYATNASLILSNVKLADEGDYSVVVSNAYGSVTSLVATLVVNTPVGFEEVAFCRDGSFPGQVYDVSVRGNYAYVAGSDGLGIFDLARPADPRLVGRLQTTNAVVSVDVNPRTKLAGIGSGNGFLQIVDVSQASSPLRLGSYTTPGFPNHVAMGGDDALVADGDGGFMVLDITTPAWPLPVWTIGPVPTNQIRGVATFEEPDNYYWSYACVVGDGLTVMENGGQFDRFIEQVGFNQECANAQAVAVAQGYAYVADDWTGLLIADVHDPARPSTVSRYFTDGSVINVAVSDGKAYLSKFEKGLEIINVSDPAAPSKLGLIETGGYLNSVAVASPYAFGADTYQGLLTFDVANPTNPVVSGGFRTDQPARSVAVDGGYAYVVYGLSGLHIFDISKAYAPKWVSHYNTPGEAVCVQATGGYAYVADRSSGLQIICVTNPANPSLVGTFGTSASTEALEVVGKYAYLADGTNGLQIVNVSNSAAPFQIGGYIGSGKAVGVHVDGPRAYLADGTNGLIILDITDPTRPLRIGEWNLSGDPYSYACAVDVAGHYAYLGIVSSDSAVAGLRILDVSIPAQPVLVGSYYSSSVGSVQVLGNYAYLSANGLEAIDIRNPAQPVLAERCSILAGQSARIVGEYAFVAGSGLSIGTLSTINPVLPSITVQPGDRVGKTGGTVSFSVEARGSRPLTFQWCFRDVVLIPGATSATLVLSNLQPSQAGYYSVTAANAYGSAVSDTARLTLDDQAPHVTQHSPVGDVSGTLSSADFWFSEAINLTTLSVSNVAVVGPGSRVIPVWGVQPVGLNRFRVSFPPQTEPGTYQITIPPTVCDLAGNPLNQDGNSIPGEATDAYVAGVNITFVDLTLTGISASTNQFWVGDTVSVSWQGTNLSGHSLAGTWSDALYISRQEKWDATALRLAIVTHTGLASNQPYSGSCTLSAPPLVPGNYYLHVWTDFGNTTRELNETNNILDFGPVVVSVPTIFPTGGLIPGELTTTAHSAWYIIQVPAGQSVVMRLDSHGTNGENQIFVAAGRMPEPWDYDYQVSTPGQGQEIAWSNTSTNDLNYYVLVYGKDVLVPRAYTMSAQVAPLVLTRSTPSRLPQGADCFLSIEGAGFDETTTVEFTGSTGQVMTASSVQVLSASTVVCRLVLTNWLSDVYNVTVSNQYETRTLTNALEVSYGQQLLESRLILPSMLMFNVPIRQTIFLEYKNNGDLPMPAPLLVLRGDYGARMTTDLSLAIPRPGVGLIPGLSDTIQVLGLGSSPMPWALQPGESGRIPVYLVGFSVSPHYANVAFTLDAITTYNNSLIDWTAQESEIRPEGMDDVAWTNLFPRIRSALGTTWGEYVSRIGLIAEEDYFRSGTPPSLQDAWLTILTDDSITGQPVAIASATNPQPYGENENGTGVKRDWVLFQNSVRWGGNSIPWRNMNPGDMQLGAFTRSHGSISASYNDFAIFPDAATGFAAARAKLTEPDSRVEPKSPQADLRNRLYQDLTLTEALRAWEGGRDPANLANYINTVIDGCQLDRDRLVSTLTSGEMGQFIEWIARAEGFYRPYDPSGTAVPYAEYFRGDANNPCWVKQLFGEGCKPPSPPKPPPCTGTCGGGNTKTVGSGDPNDKLGPAGYGDARFVQLDGHLAYEVRFENESDATAPAREIVVRDTLDPDLDLNTLELFEISFGATTLSIPGGLDQYETSVPLRSGDTDLMVDVTATLDYDTRTLTMTLSALDALTGWYPEDPMVGLLPPEDGTGRGQGSITYLVSPRVDVPTGTVITNRARVWFDYNDPIDTPLVFNTIDAGAPNSSVSPLPAEVGRTFLVRWGGQDDLGGSGLASYDVFVSSDGTNYTQWLSHTINQCAWYVGRPGQTYGFYVIARDNVGNEQSIPSAAQAVATVSTNALVLAMVANTTTMPGSGLAITNSLATGIPVGTLRFSLGLGVPEGATINETNGVFRWTPTCSQASRSYAFTIWVADTGNTNMMDVTTFTVTVSECVVPSLGQLVLRAGDPGRLPVNLISTVPLTNLAMTVSADPNRLTNLWVEPVVPEICQQSITFLTNDLQWLSLTTCSNQFLIGTQQVAWLHFTTVSNQSSAFVRLQLDDIVGHQPDGTPVQNFAPQSGRLVLIGEEPLLEAVLDTNRQPAVILYGKPASGYVIETRTDFVPGQWATAVTNLTVGSELLLQVPAPASANPVNFYRALRWQ